MVENTEAVVETCHKINVVVGAHVEAQMPTTWCDDYKWVKGKDGKMMRRPRTPTEMVEMLRDKCKEFEEFLRDHRSQDMIGLEVMLERKDVCSECEAEWEPGMEDDGTPVCAHCGTPIEAR